MSNQNKNQRQQENILRKQARSDLWNMLKAFSIMPDVEEMHFSNIAGELDISRVEREKPTRRVGFCTDAVGTEIDDGDDDDYEDDVRPAEEFDDYIRKIFKR